MGVVPVVTEFVDSEYQQDEGGGEPDNKPSQVQEGIGLAFNDETVGCYDIIPDHVAGIRLSHHIANVETVHNQFVRANRGA